MNICKFRLLLVMTVCVISWADTVLCTETMTSYTWSVLKENPRFYWDFNELTQDGDSVDRVRGQDNDTLQASGNATTVASASDNLGSTASLDGSGSSAFQAVGMNDGLMPGAWAVELWLQVDTANSAYLVTGGFNDPGLIHDYTGDNIELFASSGRTGSNGPSISDNGWHHIVATFYGNGAGFGVADRVDFSIDGVVMADVGRGGFSSAFNVKDKLTVGGDSNLNNLFQGKIDELALYDLSGLTETQVADRTAQLATHYDLLNDPATTSLRFVDHEQISYTYSTSPGGGGNYEDLDLTKLTDGAIGSTVTDPTVDDDWVGFQNEDALVTFDLGSPTSLDSIWIDYMSGGRNEIYAPTELRVRTSLDGINFSDPLTFTDFNDAGGTDYNWNRRLIAEMDGVYGQFFELEFIRGGEWTLLGEVQFVIPEPGTWLLLFPFFVYGLLGRRRSARSLKAS